MRFQFLIRLFTITIITNLSSEIMDNNKNLSHEQRELSLKNAIEHIKQKIVNPNVKSNISIQRQLELVDLIAQFDLGKFLIERGGLNGYWTHYIIKHPDNGRLTGLNDAGQPFNEIESFLLDRAPTVLATQQRFAIFKSEIQKRLKNGMRIASIPCGLMADLIDLDYSNLSDVTLIGVDIDQESIYSAQEYARLNNLENRCHFVKNNAWDLNISSELDLITSNGLAIYESDDRRVIQLYRGFFKALKPGGYLITSFLTPPISYGSQSEWKVDAVNTQDAILQKVIFSDILDCKWQIFRSEACVKAQLESAGFQEVEVRYDRAHIFPTIIAKKPL